MDHFHRENQGNSEFVTRFTEDGALWAVEVRRDGTVRYAAEGFKTQEAAFRATQEFIRAWLKAQIAGIWRCAERPAFTTKPRLGGWPTWHRPAGPFELDSAEIRARGGLPALEGAARCQCGHAEDVHRVDGTCVPDGFGPHYPSIGCDCEWFTPAGVPEVL